MLLPLIFASGQGPPCRERGNALVTLELHMPSTRSGEGQGWGGAVVLNGIEGDVGPLSVGVS